MTAITRRTFLYGSSAAALAAAIACKRKAAKGTLPSPVTASHVQVVPHEDDDLLFMNPDLQIAIASGAPVTTVYLTAGEADGDDAAALAAYAAERQKGARAAYAMMAGVADAWKAEGLAIDTDHQVELFTLQAKPHIQLVFIDLPDDADHLSSGGKHGLVRLEHDAATLSTLVPDHAAIAKPASYTAAALVAVLVKLFERAKPTVIRALDQAPDRRYVADPQWQRFHDHGDHIASAKLVDRAVRAYCSQHHDAEVVVVNYRCYNLAEVAANLPSAQREAKTAVFAKYLEHDPKSSLKSPFTEYLRSQYYRWPRGTTWVGRGADGLLLAFAVKSGALVGWRQQASGWTGPFPIGSATNLAPFVSVAADKKGRLHAVVREIDANETILSITQRKDGAWPADFTSHGSPTPAADDGAYTQVGLPLAVALPNGGIAIFVKNTGGGLCSQVAGQTMWNDLGGFEIQDGLSSIITSDHRLWIFAPTRFKALRWSQAQPDGPLVLDNRTARPHGCRSRRRDRLSRRQRRGERLVSKGDCADRDRRTLRSWCADTRDGRRPCDRVRA